MSDSGLVNFPAARLPTVTEVAIGRCPLCAGGSARPYAEGHDYELETNGNLWRFVQCDACDHVRLDPRPDETALGAIYPPTYYAYNYESKVHPLAVRAKAWLDEGKLAGILSRLDRPARRYLDVGCGNGRFLRAMERRGLGRSDLFGLELDATIANRLRGEGFQVDRSRVEDTERIPRGTIDLITLFHVIEHVAEPVPVVRRLAEWLAPGGLLALETPNRDSFDARLFRRTAWGGYHFPRHWSLFDPDGLRRMVESAGLEVVAFRYQTGHSFWLYSFHHILRYGRRPMPWLAKRFDPIGSLATLALATAFDKVRALLGFRTSAVLVIARKPE